MARVEDNQAHSLEHVFLHPVHDLVLYLHVGRVAPPGENVGCLQDRFSEAVIRLLECSRSGLQFFVLV